MVPLPLLPPLAPVPEGPQTHGCGMGEVEQPEWMGGRQRPATPPALRGARSPALATVKALAARGAWRPDSCPRPLCSLTVPRSVTGTNTTAESVPKDSAK